MTTIRIAAAQYPIDRFDTLDGYRAKISRWVADAAGQGGKLLVFPEYGAMEFAGAYGDEASDLTASLGLVADAVEEMAPTYRELAGRHGVHILGGSGPMRRAGGGFTNAARLYAPSGKTGVQHKLIMTPFEKNWGISPGSEGCLFETSLGRIGVAICYDSEFPLLVRAMCEAGADVILVPACTEFVSGFNRVRTAAMARALENGCVTVQSPTVGSAPWSPSVDYNSGAAGIFVPAERGLSDNGVVVEGKLNESGWVIGEVDIGRLRAVRLSGEMRNAQDWALQPGAGSLEQNVKVVDLR